MGKNRSPGHRYFFVLYHGFLSNVHQGLYNFVSTLGAIGVIGGSSELVDEYPEISGVTTAREAMKKMPEQDRAKIDEQVQIFRVEKRKFDIEVSKWDDNGNDIIVLAKHMCMIMMEMTDFTRGMYGFFFFQINRIRI